jgi:raffinose/stachyose/melibiose transport system permease protein
VSVSGLKREQRKYIALLLAPAILTILVFTTVPAVTTLSYAFFKWEGFQRGGFAGFANFQRLFEYPFKDQFLMALRHNVLVFIAIMILQTSFGLLLIAYALFQLKRGQVFLEQLHFCL